MAAVTKKAVVRTTAALAVLFFVGGGFLHTKAGRPLLARLGGCPVGHASAADVESMRKEAARQTRGATPAPSRPALGFRLDASTPDEVDVWMKKHGLACTDKRDGYFIKCTNVPAAAFGRTGASIDELSLAFTPAGHLVNLTAVRFGVQPGDAATHLEGIVRDMRVALGSPAMEAGERTAAFVGGTPYATTKVEYIFSDYMADVVSTNIPGTGILVREHYMSAVD